MEMMNRLNSVKIACPYIYVLCTKTSGWGTKPFCWKMMGYENYFFVQDGVWNFLWLCEIILRPGTQD